MIRCFILWSSVVRESVRRSSAPERMSSFTTISEGCVNCVKFTVMYIMNWYLLEVINKKKNTPCNTDIFNACSVTWWHT